MKTIPELKLNKKIKERRVYIFECEGGHKAQSYKATRAKKRLCRNCRKQMAMFNPNQQTLWPEAETVAA